MMIVDNVDQRMPQSEEDAEVPRTVTNATTLTPMSEILVKLKTSAVSFKLVRPHKNSIK